MPSLPNTHALLIGIADYQHVSRLPQQVRNDVQDIHAALIDPHLCAYPPENVTLLLDGQATQAAIRQALTDLANKIDDDATVLGWHSRLWYNQDKTRYPKTIIILSLIHI